MPNELSELESIEVAISHLRRATKKEFRDERKMSSDVNHLEKDVKKNNSSREVRDDERVERDIYHFLYHTIRSMNYLIQIEKNESAFEKQDHIKNKFKEPIEKEVRVLIRELRAIGSLDARSL